MQFKKGYNWKACYDEERGLYTAQYGQYGGYTLYEITKEIFDRLEDAVTTELDACRLLDSGRRLYKSVDDRCGPPYDIVFDEDFRNLCPWANIPDSRGTVLGAEMTDAVVEVLASERNNREQRREKRRKREERNGSTDLQLS